MSPCQPDRAIRAIAESRHPRRWQATTTRRCRERKTHEDGTPQVSLGVKPPTAAGQLSARTRQVTFRRRRERLASIMSVTTPSLALPRRFAAVLIAALLGLTLALNPMSATKAHAAVPANVALAALHIAATQRGVLYRYGGESHWTGFDCSGLTQWSYAQAGRYIPRVAQQQYDATIHIPASARRQGDLVFFHTGNSVYHVGIFAGGWYMIDAPHTGARVRMEMIWPGALFGRVR
jgi:hypothetical protein